MPADEILLKEWDLAVVGAGPAGVMAAIRAGGFRKKVILIERNSSLGKKLLITGKGRCNITNTASIDEFIGKFGGNGEFLRTAFFVFFNEDLMDFFKSKGLSLKIERQGRVFPEDDRALSVLGILEKTLLENGVDALYNSRVSEIKKENERFRLEIEGKGCVFSKKVILATGGVSYKKTGSTGDGFRIAKTMGHTFTALRPGLAPLTTEESWVKDLQGLTLKNVRVTFECGRKKIISDIGELLWTHFGVSGPLVLDLSNEITSFLRDNKRVVLSIDLKPGLDHNKLEDKILRYIKEMGGINVQNMFKDMLPARLIPVFIKILGIDGVKKVNQLTQEERKGVIEGLKRFRVTIKGALALEDAMVTLGGISTRQINPRTMESRIVKGLYFAGEIIDASASSGGYNLQQAFSTGYLAGQESIKYFPDTAGKGLERAQAPFPRGDSDRARGEEAS